MGCAPSKKSGLSHGATLQAEKMLSPKPEKVDSELLKHRFIKRLPFNQELPAPGQNDTVLYGDTIKINDGNQNIIKKISILGDHNSPYLLEDLSIYLRIWKTYYSNGNIKVKGLDSWLGFNFGKQYWFDEAGNLTKVKDWDIGYNFSFDDVLNFCDRNKIILVKYSDGAQCRVEKHDFSGSPAWFITAYYPRYPQKTKWVTIILDGRTGETKDIQLARVHPE